MPSRFDCYVHVPFLQLQPEDAPPPPAPSPGTSDSLPANSPQANLSIPLSPGALVTLPFDRWLQLEDPAAEFLESRYVHAAPVFFHRTLDFPADEISMEDDILPVLRDDYERLSIALLFVFADAVRTAAIPSVIYVSSAGSSATMREFGTTERELLFHTPSEFLLLAPPQLAVLRVAYSRLLSINAGSATPGILRLVDVIRLMARPNLNEEDAIIHFVSLQEDLQSSGGRAHMGRLGETFARRAALLYSPSVDAVPGFQRAFHDLYSLRSAILHGEDAGERVQAFGQKLPNGIADFLFFLTYRCSCHLGFLASKGSDLSSSLSELIHQIDSLPVSSTTLRVPNGIASFRSILNPRPKVWMPSLINSSTISAAWSWPLAWFSLAFWSISPESSMSSALDQRIVASWT
jgi:hypothetical protein